MNFPVEVHFGQYTVYLHFIAETLAFFIGFRFYVLLRKRKPDLISSDNRIWIILGAIFGAILGSRLIGGLENIPTHASWKNIFIHFYENKTVVGGFLGGLFGVELMKKVIGEKSSSGDLFTYPMILGLIIGRIGCFSMGIYEETYGIPTSFFTGMDLGDGVLRHPVTLYEITFLIILWCTLIQMEKQFPLKNGSLFKLFMISYLLFRFCIDFIKPHYYHHFPLSAIQMTCLLGLLYYSRYIFNPRLLIDKPVIHL